MELMENSFPHHQEEGVAWGVCEKRSSIKLCFQLNI